jgi:hypothetical protein
VTSAASAIPDFDALLTAVLPYLRERAGADSVDVTTRDSTLAVTWPDGEFTADRYALASSRTSMRRLGAGQRPETDEHTLYWLFLSDADGGRVWSGRVLDPGAVVSVIHRWLHPSVPAPVTFSPGDLATAPARQGELRISIPSPLPGAQVLSEEDAALLDAVLARIDPVVLARNWPRDAKGRPAPRTTVILAEFNTPSTTKRQPCLVLTSGTLKDATTAASVTSVYVDNSRFDWSGRPELWSDSEGTGVEPPAPTTEPGWFDRYAVECGVVVDDSVRLLAAGEPWTRFGDVPDAWPQELRSALADMNTARVPEALRRVRDRLDGSRKTRLKVGNLQRRMLLFSGQRGQSKWGLFLTEVAEGSTQGTAPGTPLLTISHSGANTVIPDAWWRRD